MRRIARSFVLLLAAAALVLGVAGDFGDGDLGPVSVADSSAAETNRNTAWG